MANVNRQGATPLRRTEGTTANPYRAGQVGPVPIRRNVADFDDPYLPEESYSGTVICRSCQAVFQNDRWSLDTHLREEALRSGEVQYRTCPACLKLRDKQPGGIVTLTSAFITGHHEEMLNLIRNEDARASNTNPLERIMAIEMDTDQIVVSTTNEKLAQRIGRAVRRAYGGHVQYQWGGDNRQARIWWTR